MEKKENQRVALTKRLIGEAFVTLLRKKSISQIAIRELCQTAGINRSTFYAHYGSQYDVLSELTDGYLAEIEKTIASADAADKADITRRVTIVLCYAEKNLELSRLLLNHNLDPAFAEKLVSLPKIQDMLSTALSWVEADELGCYIDFIVSGCYRLIRDWLNADERIPPAQQAGRILAMARRVCIE